MKNKKRLKEATNWFKQAEYDFKAARWNFDGGFYNTVCFLSQQAAEKALKALIYFSGMSRQKLLTHSVFNLLKRTCGVIPELNECFEEARELDLHYIPSRYPNGLVSGFPHQFYGEKTAQNALIATEKILGIVKNYFIQKGFNPDEYEDE